jgi:hypothetical protein
MWNLVGRIGRYGSLEHIRRLVLHCIYPFLLLFPSVHASIIFLMAILSLHGYFFGLVVRSLSDRMISQFRVELAISCTHK